VEGVSAMRESDGVLTLKGGKTSHAAVNARAMNKTAVVGAEADLALTDGRLTEKKEGRSGRSFNEGDAITIDGTTGRIYAKEQLILKGSITEEVYGALTTFDDIVRAVETAAKADAGVEVDVIEGTDAQAIYDLYFGKDTELRNPDNFLVNPIGVKMYFDDSHDIQNETIKIAMNKNGIAFGFKESDLHSKLLPSELGESQIEGYIRRETGEIEFRKIFR